MEALTLKIELTPEQVAELQQGNALEIKLTLQPPVAPKHTAETVREKLGLEPFKAYSEKRKRDNRLNLEMPLIELDRRTGRTTKMLCEAIAARMNADQVVVVVPYLNIGRYMKQELNRLWLLINKYSVEWDVRTDKKADLIGLPTETRIYKDHTCFEFEFNRAVGKGLLATPFS